MIGIPRFFTKKRNINTKCLISFPAMDPQTFDMLCIDTTCKTTLV